MANTLKFGLGQWATKKGSTLAYNDENGNFKPLPFTFDRSTSATRVNKEGLIEVVSNNEPRIDFLNDSNGALLLEPSRTNLVPYSEDFSNAAWNKSFIGIGSVPVVTANQGLAPDGTFTADRIVLNLNGGVTSGDGSFLSETVTVSSGATVSLSIYLKSNTGLIQNLIVWEAFTGASTSCVVTNEWQRFNVIATVPSTSSGLNFGLRNAFGVTVDDTADILVWGAQLEQGSYATSYIPTQGSIGTRVAETCSDAGNDQVFNDSEGVLFAEISALTDGGTTRRLSISDGSTSNRLVLSYNSTSNQIQSFLANPSVQFNFYHTLNNSVEFNKIAVKYKQNDFALWINGVEVATDTNGTISNGLNTLNFDEGSGASDFYGNTKQIKYFNQALTDAELAALTKI